MNKFITMILYALVTFSITAVILYFSYKKLKTDKQIMKAFRIGTIITLIIHYSDFFKELIVNGKIVLTDNLLLIVYPCNLIMWLCVFLSFFNDTNSKVFKIVSEFVSFGGLLCAFLGVILNANYCNNPDLTDFGIFKGLLSHNTMIYSQVLLIVTKRVKLSALRNFFTSTFGVLLMMAFGLYDRLLDILFEVNPSDYNAAMFLFSVPFDSMPWATFPVMMAVGLSVIFVVLNVLELIIYKKGNRWFNKKDLGLKF